MDNHFQKACDILQNMDISFVVDNLSIRVDFIRVEHFKPGSGFDDHAHANFEFHYIKAGLGTVNMEGKTINLVPGSMYVTGPGIIHNQLSSKDDPMIEYAMKCSIGFVKAASDIKTKSEETYILSVLNNSAGFVVQDIFGVDTHYETLFEEASQMRPGYYGQIKAMLYRIIFTTARGLDTSLNVQYNVPSRNLNQYRTEIARHYILDNLNRNITCQELSKHLYLSEKQLGRIIRAETGLSAYNFILTEKLNRVKQLLAEPNLTLHAISVKTGFSSEFHLSTTFRKKVGMSPVIYRKQLKKDSSAHSKVLQNIPKGHIPLYPLKFRPLYKDYIWGGRNLEKLGKVLPEGKVAESWEISTHHDGMTVIANGVFEGSNFEDLVLEHGEAFVGTVSYEKYKKRFPLLLKFIDANEWLSVQVHPNDSHASIYKKDAGKTEAWLILDAQPDAAIIYGLNQDLKRDQLESIVKEGRLREVLRYHPVRKGDMIYVPAGTIHAAGKGILLAEVQQNANATYRLYDFDRRNPDGTARALHLNKALDVIDYENLQRNGFVEGLSACPQPELNVEYLVADPHFCIQRLNLDGEATFRTDARSFHALIIISGRTELMWKGGSLPLKAGESLLIPAAMGEYSIRGQVTVLKSFIGDLERDILKPLAKAGYSQEEILSKVAGIPGSF